MNATAQQQSPELWGSLKVMSERHTIPEQTNLPLRLSVSNDLHQLDSCLIRGRSFVFRMQFLNSFEFNLLDLFPFFVYFSTRVLVFGNLLKCSPVQNVHGQLWVNVFDQMHKKH